MPPSMEFEASCDYLMSHSHTTVGKSDPCLDWGSRSGYWQKKGIYRPQKSCNSVRGPGMRDRMNSTSHFRWSSTLKNEFINNWNIFNLRLCLITFQLVKGNWETLQIRADSDLLGKWLIGGEHSLKSAGNFTFCEWLISWALYHLLKLHVQYGSHQKKFTLLII